MRITQRMLTQGALRDLNLNVETMQRAAQQVSTTKRLNKPSDNPSDVQSAIKLSDNLAELDQYMRNIDAAKTRVSAADGALADAGDVIQRARELAVQGSTSSLNATDRAGMQQEVDQLLAQVVQDASAKMGDQFLFSGFKTSTPPYASTGPGAVSAYAGDHGEATARIAPGSTLQTNIAGDTAFQPAIDALVALHNDLASGALVQGATLTKLDAGLQGVLSGRATLGARSNRLDDTKSFHQDVQTAGTELLSNLVDVDMTKAISELSSRQLSYQAALKVNATMMQASLIDDLR